MPRTKAPTDELLRRIAEGRAGGLSWEAVGESVGRKANTIRAWPAAHSARWAKFLRAARRHMLAEATAESVHTLRRHLRSEDEKISRDAAGKLLQAGLAARKRSTRAAPTAISTDATRIAGFLESFADDELDALIVALWDQRSRRVGGRATDASLAASPCEPG